MAASDARKPHRMRLLSWGIVVVSQGAVPGAVRLHLADGVPLLRPDEQVFQAMLDGWRNQQLARNLARSTVEGREGTVKAFAGYVSAYPWAWTTETPNYAVRDGPGAPVTRAVTASSA